MPELISVKKYGSKYILSILCKYIHWLVVRNLINISNIETLKKFMWDMAIRNGKLLNYSEVSNDVGIK